MSLFYQTISLLCEGGILKALVTLPRGVELRIGTPVRDYFEAPWNAYFTGTITKLPATNAGVWEVTFSDGNKLDYDTEPEIRQVLDVTKMEQWQPLVTKLKGGFTYLENRLTNNCDSPYHLKVQHEATKLLRAFDPSLASGLVDANYVDAMRTIDPLVEHDLIDKMKAELPFYLSACSSASLVVDQTTGMLRSSPLRFSNGGRSPTSPSSQRGPLRRASSSHSRQTRLRASASSHF